MELFPVLPNFCCGDRRAGQTWDSFLCGKLLLLVLKVAALHCCCTVTPIVCVAVDRFFSECPRTLLALNNGVCVCVCVQAYEFMFDPRNGQETVASNVKPVSTGVIVVTDAMQVKSSSDTATTFPFHASISECWQADHEEFGSWPRMAPSTSYFVVFAVAGSTGNLNPALEGTIASTT